ncbi:hypothetical protein CQW31_07780 [Pseudomonas sp. 382]|nr:hypothetical protein DZC31_04255 [Stenotrophomonas rhizophila]PIK78957.1 hypothetical protein CQW31_07780 [Pseudomonas sp. 382]
MLARLAGNATHLKTMGAIAPEKTATKSNMADGQRLAWGFGEVFIGLIGRPDRNAPASRGVLGGSHGVAGFQLSGYPTDAGRLAGNRPCWH